MLTRLCDKARLLQKSYVFQWTVLKLQGGLIIPKILSIRAEAPLAPLVSTLLQVVMHQKVQGPYIYKLY